MSKRKRDQLERPICGRVWMRGDIINSPYMDNIIQYDLVEELQWMHNTKSIYKLVPMIVEKITDFWRENHKYPMRCFIWLEIVFKQLFMQFPILHYIVYLRDINVELDIYMITRMSILLDQLEIYSQKVKCSNNFSIYSWGRVGTSDRHHPYIYYESLLNTISWDLYKNAHKIRSLSTEFIQHFASAYIAFTVQLIPRDIWYNRINSVIRRIEPNPISNLMFESVNLRKL